jgi:hypothetical protein
MFSITIDAFKKLRIFSKDDGFFQTARGINSNYGRFFQTVSSPAV